MKEIRTAVIGIGNMGTAHARCIGEGRIGGLRLSAVCDIREERLRWCASAFPEAARFPDWEALLRAGAADALVIAVPHPLHARIAAEALRAGLHVLSEKPLDISVLRAREAVRAAGESGRVFAVMFNQRTNPVFRRAREIVRGGELGELKRSIWIITNWYRTQHYYDSGDWRATWAGEGGGVLLNQAPHNLDLWQWICGMPCEVTARCSIARYHRIEVEDDAVILARYDGGATGIFVTSTGEAPGTNRLEITGTRGKLVLEGGSLKWWRLRQDEREVCRTSTENFTRIPYDYEEIVPDEPETAHEGILQNFADAVLRGAELIAPGADGLRELAISNAAYLSAWQGGVPVAIPLDEALFDRMLRERAEASSLRDARHSHTPDGRYSERWQVSW